VAETAQGPLGLNTNVIARLVLADDAAQTRRAQRVLAQAVARGQPVMLTLGVLLELEWVLRSRAGLDKAAVLRVFKGLLEARDLRIEHEGSVERALYAWEQGGADFADCLHLARYRDMGCSTMLTFDRAAARLGGARAM
jgi:predicted nucleic-acid-binding protein